MCACHRISCCAVNKLSATSNSWPEFFFFFFFTSMMSAYSCSGYMTRLMHLKYATSSFNNFFFLVVIIGAANAEISCV